MSIPTEHEDVEELKKWGMGLSSILERCYFCGVETRYWYKPKNIPVCQSCSIFHNEDEIK